LGYEGQGIGVKVTARSNVKNFSPSGLSYQNHIECVIDYDVYMTYFTFARILRLLQWLLFCGDLCYS